MKTYTIRNSFHNTSVNVRCKGLEHIYGEVTIQPNKRQLKRIRAELCGSKTCTCGRFRGPQETDDGKYLIVDRSAEFAS